MSFISIFKKKEITRHYNGDCAIIKLTNSAKDSFVNDDWNRVIIRYRDGYPGIPDEPIEFTPEEARALKEVEGIPIIFERLGTGFEFDQETNFGEVITRR